MGYVRDPFQDSDMALVLRRIVATEEARLGKESGKGAYIEARKTLLALQPDPSPQMLGAAEALRSGHVQEAKGAATDYLEEHSNDPCALTLLAEIACQSGNKREAEFHLAECVRSHPNQIVCRYNYSLLLLELRKLRGARAEAETLLQHAPLNIIFRTLRAVILVESHSYPDAVACYRELTEECPDSADLWFGFAGVLRSLGGHGNECIAALRKAITLCPWSGKYWWSLASLKTVHFSANDVQLMESQVASPAVSYDDRADLHYALGRGYDDLEDYGKSVSNYAKGNALRRCDMHYDADETSALASRTSAAFTEEIFRKFDAVGSPSPQPIFVLGLQRAGSTLTEQILDSHSAIEGLGEPPFVSGIVGYDVVPRTGADYPRGIDTIEPSDLRSMGERYLAMALRKKRTAKPFFVDKCPSNVWHLGLILLMLPNAKIIDVRRHPMACCYANFTMSFAHAPPVSYSLSDIGRFYADYVRLTAHFDRVLPGRIFRVFYERLVTNFEAEVRRILDFLGLPFESSCLEYYRNSRAFNSYSNEQVRSPIFTDSLEHWRRYEPWLGSLKAALGPELDAYPGVPDFG